MIWLYILIAVFILIIAVITGTAYYLFSFAILRKDQSTVEEKIQKIKDTYKDDPVKSEWGYIIEDGYKKLTEQPLEDVFITGRDGLRLHASLLECEGATKTVIFSHGWRSISLYEFSCIWEYYYDHKFNILFIDHRAHGKSEGKYLCFGVKERFDIIDWINWVNNRYGIEKKIFLSGISMGSAAVMMAVGTNGLPKNVVGASCDCGYTSVYDIFNHVVKHDFHLPTVPLLNVAELFTKLKAKFAFNEFTSTQGVKNAKIPLLFIHGTADTFVPVEHTYINSKACASEHIDVIVEGAEHGMSYLTDPAAVKNGLEKILKKVFDDFE